MHAVPSPRCCLILGLQPVLASCLPVPDLLRFACVAGHLVSGFVKQHLPIILVNHLTSQKDVPKALSAGFIEVDKSLGGSRIDCEFSGSTAVVSYLKGRTLTTAWVGDSRGVIARHAPATGWQAVDLTNDHKPTNPEEKARILRSNGRVERWAGAVCLQ